MGRKSEAYGPFFNGEAENSRYYEKTYYDKMGRVDYIESPSGVPTDPTIIDYNYPNYFTTVITDQDNKQKTEKRDHLGRIFEVIEHANTGNQSTFYWYNAAGDMLEVENALGYSTLITYDARGLKLTMDDPDMGYWSYTYDENGNLSTQTDAKSQVITFTYELLNRVYQKTYTPSVNNPTVTYTYDNAINGLGQLYSVTNSNVTTTFNEYDEMGRVVSVTKTITGDQARTTETEYDLSGKVKKITHPDNFEVTNTYYPGTNLLDNVKGTFDDVNIKEYAKCTEYEPTGKIGRITHPYNDTETVYTYNLQTTRLTNLVTLGPAPNNYTIQSRLYTYSKAGDLLTITDSSGSTPVTYTYQYDNLHRLLSEDVAGALLPPTTYEAMIFTYNDPDHINAVSSISHNGTPYAFTYDLNGNMVSGYDFTNPVNIFKRSLTWNADNMPLTVSRNGIVTTTLTYDGNGARAKKVAGGITTYYVSSDYEIKNGVATKYVFAGNMRVASVEGTNINNSKIFHKDHLGSSTAITDSTGADAETTEYMPFGVQRSHSGANASDYKYTDQELDNESGLYNYDARLYDPVIGRFLSVDSIIPKFYVPQSLNPYSYTLNNPLKYTDPTGHAANQWYPNMNAAAHDFAVTYNDDSIRNKAEYSSSFYAVTNDKGEPGVAYTTPYMHRGGASVASLPEGNEPTLGNIHTHRNYDKKSRDGLSDNDRDLQDGKIPINDLLREYDGRNKSDVYTGEPMYVATPLGYLWVRYYKEIEGEKNKWEIIEEKLTEYTDIPSDRNAHRNDRANEKDANKGNDDPYYDWGSKKLIKPDPIYINGIKLKD